LAGIDGVTEVRGEGLLIGFDLAEEVAAPVVRAALEAGFIINNPGPRTLRLAPPLILTGTQAGTFIRALPAILAAAAETAAETTAAANPAAPNADAPKDTP
jgi:acetylornithine aminotransferase